MPRGRYREVAPSPALRADVACFWCLEHGHPGPGTSRILPDGCFDLLFVTEGRVGRRASGPLAGGHVVGPMSRAIVVSADGPATVIGVRFRPGGLSRFLRIELDRLLDVSVPGADLLGSAFRRLEHSVVDAGGLEPAVRAIERHLVAHLPPDSTETARVRQAIDRLIRTSGGLPIARLSDEVGASARTLERLFRREVGLPPKGLARVVRFRNALARLAADRPAPLARIAFELGYADQAHLTREFVEFAGLSPVAYRKETGGPPVSDSFKTADDIGAIIRP